MACGCIVIGYDGGGSKEFFKEELCYPVEYGDLKNFADTVEMVIKQFADNKDLLLEKGKRASNFILKEYSLEREERDILAAWGKIFGERKRHPQKAVDIRYGERKYTFYGWGEKDNIFRYLRETGSFYELEILDFIKNRSLKPGVYVDVGAHIGNHTIFFANECKSSKVYAFECRPEVFELLQLNCKLNLDNQKKCELHNLAVTMEREVFIRPDPDSDISMTQIPPAKDTGTIKASASALDAALRDVSNITLIKIDVEGVELEVLKSAAEILKRDSPVILIESKPDKFEQSHQFLRGLDYDITKRFESDPYLYLYEKLKKA